MPSLGAVWSCLGTSHCSVPHVLYRCVFTLALPSVFTPREQHSGGKNRFRQCLTPCEDNNGRWDFPWPVFDCLGWSWYWSTVPCPVSLYVFQGELPALPKLQRREAGLANWNLCIRSGGGGDHSTYETEEINDRQEVHEC